MPASSPSTYTSYLPTGKLLLRTPHPMLRPFVERIWYVDGYASGSMRERVLPKGKMRIIVNLHEDEIWSYPCPGQPTSVRANGAIFSGAIASPFDHRTTLRRHGLGVVFHAGGTLPFFDHPGRVLAGTFLTLDDLWGREGLTLRERLLDEPTADAQLDLIERMLLARLSRSRLLVDASISFAITALEQNVPVASVASHTGLAPKVLIRRFREVTGVTPKTFARVRRFHRVLESVDLGRTTSWAAVAADHGYYDHAHMIRDFYEFAGLTPTKCRPNHMEKNTVFIES